ncbi:MerR family transcriptional regulator [Ignatzschineria cameli]|uniref:Cd(II)/Pb(II)-responsive transcriptional regulator n=1 Tax=Ignatzschineria cameli TaxID=2182793 RepID=A0A2U2ALB6_9GAMM|nr:MerR family transcriptional regulator [Ignatzschineria cameli]PWD83624.1 Cd(II)/Pb(II)-responsive transcriptional regulator [Ignatzschineria cameli]PWD84010.1 Cd(II)/Pb(II)-responsive transcriptional regulator [Ignatzschineria cameli]PWD89017.1 Cd(II)/Pb(II)-responsive transcriptional regulator [Ignatzschineria cameli]PWD90103.1 Cd(II)/Pb(II)-responsive transcriptional regulator [Ignatzschineria cameli]PWD90766.1 Cd(II)/Pb(II)-responsive transcriptional regulator [Ignatzschineria cameli]
MKKRALQGNKTYLIGELATLSRVPVETIRFYEKEKLLAAPERASNNYRIYRFDHLQRLILIRNCRAFDMSLEEIRQVIDATENGDESCLPINEIIQDHLFHIDERIQELTTLKAMLADIQARCTQNHTADNCSIIDEIHQLDPEEKKYHNHLS